MLTGILFKKPIIAKLRFFVVLNFRGLFLNFMKWVIAEYRVLLMKDL
jgi:hypothetical protein